MANKKLLDVAELFAIEVSAIFVNKLKLSVLTVNKDKYTGEIPNKLKLLVSQFAEFPQRKIAKIFANKFWPKNLYQLYHM